MADKTGIQWTDATWNPIRGCARVSKGCEHCYAERQARRMDHPGGAYEGLTVLGKHGPRWNGKVRLVPELLSQPLRWTRPRLVFVNSMSDLFHEDVPFAFIAAVFGVMAACPQHTFQVLTKRPERALEWFRWVSNLKGTAFPGKAHPDYVCAYEAMCILGEDSWRRVRDCGRPWPLPNVWLGVSCEDQAEADERIPLLLQCPAAVRWVSAEPLLGPLNLCNVPLPEGWPEGTWLGHNRLDALCIGARAHLDWVVVGGESGPRARPCDMAWIRSMVQQCCGASVPVFVKQLGSHVAVSEDGMDALLSLQHKKAGEPSEWPEDLRVREWPVLG